MGPALVLQEDTTLVVPPGAAVTVLPDGSLVCRSWELDDPEALEDAEVLAGADEAVVGTR